MEHRIGQTPLVPATDPFTAQSEQTALETGQDAAQEIFEKTTSYDAKPPPVTFWP